MDESENSEKMENKSEISELRKEELIEELKKIKESRKLIKEMKAVGIGLRMRAIQKPDLDEELLED